MIRSLLQLVVAVVALGALMGGGYALVAAAAPVSTRTHASAPAPSLGEPIRHSTPSSSSPRRSSSSRPSASAAKPLAGVVVAIDPGHQLGNHNFPRQIDRLVNAGGIRKACNTTGAATNAGMPEATITWRVARDLRARLRTLGATVVMTRNRNSERKWGPCVDVRGRFPGKHHAALMISLHGDGAPSAGHGFHIITAPASKTSKRLAARSHALALAMRYSLRHSTVGITRSTYVGHGTAFDVRTDLGTLNLSTVPTAMIEMGNLRNAHDAAILSSVKGERRYAYALGAAVRRFVGR